MALIHEGHTHLFHGSDNFSLVSGFLSQEDLEAITIKANRRWYSRKRCVRKGPVEFNKVGIDDFVESLGG